MEKLNADRESLFIVSLPRSLSTLVYHFSRLTLGLEEPGWASDGEILNADRLIFNLAPDQSVSLKYLKREQHEETAFRIESFLEHAVVQRGMAYKDVVHPFILADWLPSQPIRVLKIRRNVTEVAYSMIRKQWFYPGMASAHAEQSATAVIDGLLAALEVIEGIPGETVDFDDIVENETTLFEALDRLYDGATQRHVRFIDESFQRQRDRILERRQSPLYRDLEEIVDQRQRPKLPKGGPKESNPVPCLHASLN